MRHQMQNRLRFRPGDAAALVLCAAVFGFLLYCAPRGMGTPDESFYFTIPQRILAGDRLLVDEWQVSQFSSLLQVLPYAVFTSLTGGTEGIVLFFRYLYIFCGFCLYWVLYLHLREHGAAAAAAAALFALSAQNAIFTLNYYTMAVQGLAVCCVLLFRGSRPAGAVRSAAAGFVFACAVLAQPPLALLWLMYAGYSLMKTRGLRRSDAAGARQAKKAFLFATLGAGICAAFVFVCLAVGSGLSEIARMLPELFTDANHSFFSKDGTLSRYLQKFGSASELYGGLWLASLAAVCCLSFPVRFLPKQRRAVRLALSVLLCVAFCGACVHACGFYAQNAKATRTLTFHGLPALGFGVGMYFLTEKKDAGTAPFLTVGAAASVAIDLFSDIALGSGAALTLLFTLPAFTKLVLDGFRAFRAAAGKKDRTAALACAALAAVCAASSCACFGGWQAVYCGYCVTPVYERTVSLLQVMSRIPTDTSVGVKLDRGPLKGTYTTEWLRTCYQKSLDDIDRIRERGEGRLCVAAPYAYLYLYARMPYGTYSAYYNEANAAERLERYWELVPEKKARYLYFPRDQLAVGFPFPDEDVEAFSQKHDCETEKGKAGYLVELRE